MSQNNDSALFRIARRIAPIKKPNNFVLPNLDTSFDEPGLNIINIPPPPKPDLTDNLCLMIPIEEGINTLIKTEGICSVIDSIDILFDFSNSLSLFEVLKFNGKTGKDYRKENDVEENYGLQIPLKDFEETCIHGFRKPLCARCSQSTYSDAQKKLAINIFDLLLPLLQPPLGENYDSSISLPKLLYSFQRDGVRFLVENSNALLADDMGTGKSIQAIVALRVLFRMGKVKSGLVVCPKSVLFDWEKKFWDWAPELQVQMVRGHKDHRLVIWKTPTHIHLVTYDTLRNDIGEIPINKFDVVVLDEIQRIKNPGTATYKSIQRLSSPLRWGLSGTPLENRIEELIAIFSYLRPKLLRYEDAKNPYFVKKQITPYFLRRRLKDVQEELNLGDKVENEIWLELTDTQRAAYQKARDEGVVKLNNFGDSITIQHVLALITHLKQICNRDSVTEDSCKLEYLIDTLENDIDEEEKVLVFSQYPEKTLRPIQKELTKFGTQLFTGKLTDKKRRDVLSSFENDDNRVLLMSLKAGGIGLTITRANHVFHFDHWWNPAIAAQAEGRAHRIGQEKTVFVTTLFTRDTIEEEIHRILARKRAIFEEIVDDLSDSRLSTLLTEEELFGLFGLGTRAKTKKPLKKKQLEDLSPYEFEDMVSDLCRKIGYYVKQTTRSKDGGIDLYAKRETGTGIENVIIECKHYPNGIVGVDKVRELYGVLASKPDISRAVLITSGQFSSSASNFASGKNLNLINGDELRGILLRYK